MMIWILGIAFAHPRVAGCFATAGRMWTHFKECRLACVGLGCGVETDSEHDCVRQPIVAFSQNYVGRSFCATKGSSYLTIESNATG